MINFGLKIIKKQIRREHVIDIDLNNPKRIWNSFLDIISQIQIKLSIQKCQNAYIPIIFLSNVILKTKR